MPAKSPMTNGDCLLYKCRAFESLSLRLSLRFILRNIIWFIPPIETWFSTSPFRKTRNIILHTLTHTDRLSRSHACLRKFRFCCTSISYFLSLCSALLYPTHRCSLYSFISFPCHTTAKYIIHRLLATDKPKKTNNNPRCRNGSRSPPPLFHPLVSFACGNKAYNETHYWRGA